MVDQNQPRIGFSRAERDRRIREVVERSKPDTRPTPPTGPHLVYEMRRVRRLLWGILAVNICGHAVDAALHIWG